ncbi:MAG: putative toxin-antitoxin system toxin component, PIN family [Parcubacteria group bacterium]|nr:putative toxin-antitoxin system toxin component, PIN family [Parcubacteria group bacterium]
MKTRVVFDTNILVSAIAFGGNPKVCLELAHQKQISAFTSKMILLELVRTLHKKFQWPEDEIQNAVHNITTAATVVIPQMKINVITQDPADNIILEAALESRADYIISGDKKHLLPLKTFQHIPIVSATKFLSALD